MSTKENVLELLLNNGSRYVSGQEMADKLYVTRAAIWKAIKALEKEGYEIEAVTNRGYRLKERIRILSYEGIKKALLESSNELPKEFYGELIYFNEVDSTNRYARDYAGSNIERNALIIASSQKKGCGRRGRSFYSPDNTGIYLSLLLYPKRDIEISTKVTSMMAVAVCRAILEVTGIETNIKWVNDIFYNEKKIAGILTEGSTCIEEGKFNYVIIGVGINLYEPYDGFPKELADIAGALLQNISDGEIASKLCASIIKHFYKIISSENDMAYVEEYRNRSMLIGKYVKIMKLKTNDYGRVLGIDDDCRLMVEYDDGSQDFLFTGEVSVVKY